MTDPTAKTPASASPGVRDVMIIDGQEMNVARIRVAKPHGEAEVRAVVPSSIYWGEIESSSRPGAQWLLIAWDAETHALRSFATKDVEWL